MSPLDKPTITIAIAAALYFPEAAAERYLWRFALHHILNTLHH